MRSRAWCAAAVLPLLVATAWQPAPAQAASPTCGGKRVTILGTSGNDVLRGTRRADVIDGLAGSDVINGLEGDDTICGGYGADDLRGNAGDDRLYGGMDAIVNDGGEQWSKTGDVLRGGSGDDTLVPGADARTGYTDGDVEPDTLTFDTAPRGVDIDLLGQVATGDGTDRVVVNGPVRLETTRWADRVVGSPYGDTILTFAGPDRVWGAGGRDTVFVDDNGRPDDAADLAFGGPDVDVLVASGGDDRLVGGTGDDRIIDNGERSNDTLEGGEGDDEVTDEGTRGVDTLLGQDGDDRVQVHVADGGSFNGGDGQDVVDVVSDAAADARLTLATGQLLVEGTSPVDLLLLGFEAHGYAGGALEATGTAGPDVVLARATSVQMEGLGGDDVLWGTPGDDYFDGGDGLDCFEESWSQAGEDTLVDVELTPSAPARCAWP